MRRDETWKIDLTAQMEKTKQPPPSIFSDELSLLNPIPDKAGKYVKEVVLGTLLPIFNTSCIEEVL
ncbi:hypothetical protein HJC23_006984 [Cyclotella cryptica]|uniref:Uncharacterized protein n=1 Tax=Cyclotella cryptica TaxID=29204 RepID=A0ABD3QMX5_9STRA